MWGAGGHVVVLPATTVKEQVGDSIHPKNVMVAHVAILIILTGNNSDSLVHAGLQQDCFQLLMALHASNE